MGWKAAEKLIRHWKILRGDNVMIIRGKDKGESGLIKRVIRSQNCVIVEGKNLGSTGSLPGDLADFGTGLYALAVDIEALNILTNELVVSQDHMMVGC